MWRNEKPDVSKVKLDVIRDTRREEGCTKKTKLRSNNK